MVSVVDAWYLCHEIIIGEALNSDWRIRSIPARREPESEGHIGLS